MAPSSPNIIKKAIARTKYFIKLTNKKQGTSIKSATKIYKTICLPILEYAHPQFAVCQLQTSCNKKPRGGRTYSIKGYNKNETAKQCSTQSPKPAAVLNN